MLQNHDPCCPRFDGYPKRIFWQEDLRSWPAAASSPSGDPFLFQEQSNPSGVPTTRSFRGFAGELDMLRTRLACLLARAEEACKHRNVSEEHVRWMASTIQLLEADMAQARESVFGWQDIHSDDASLSARCRKCCDDLLQMAAKLDAERH